MRTLANVQVPMRDGVLLATDILLPDGAGPFPAVLTRTPYGKRRFIVGAPEMYPEAGYALIAQDCRGRYDSQGEWFPVVHEALDGYDTIEWIARQPWCTGRVGMVGGSYQGIVQWAAASALPPHLACIVPQETPADHYENWMYRGGAVQLVTHYPWAIYVDGRECQALPGKDLPRLFRTLPLSDADRAAGRTLRHWREWLAHPCYDAFWAPQNFEAAIDRISVPALNVGGWYDMYSQCALACFARQRAQGGSPAARQGARAIIGPWTHGTWCQGKGSRRCGEVDFGPEAELNVDRCVLRFLHRWLREDDPGPDAEPPLQIFGMGRNQWRHEWQWPPAGADRRRLYLHGRDVANTLNGNGFLSLESPAYEPCDQFTYDPLDPVPTLGGNHSGDFAGTPAGPLDQRPVEQRRDVLVYSTPPLEDEIEVIGPVSLHLAVSSSAPDTDFTGKLVDVCPDGRAICIVDGIRRASYRESAVEPSPLVPEKVYELEVELGATAHCFGPGHRLRLEVSSSNFPRYSRNLNTGQDCAHGTATVVANQTVYHQCGRSSWLELSIAPVAIRGQAERK